ncbi:MAG: hypothetical protein ACR2MN_13415 [Acidimicrobiales bacterium]
MAELICAAGLWRRAHWAGVAAAVLLVVIWPANLQMAINAQHGHALTTTIEDWIRFPLQIPPSGSPCRPKQPPVAARQRPDGIR